MKMIYLSLLFYMVVICGSGECMSNEYKPAEYVVMSKAIIADMAKILPKKYGMEVISTTSGLAKRVNVLGLGFQIKGPLTKEQLREILVDCEEEFLAKVNENERIRPYLKNYPFNAENIELEIFVNDSQTGEMAVDPFITVASISNGLLVYRTEHKDPKTSGYKSKVLESYEDAFRIVKEGKSFN